MNNKIILLAIVVFCIPRLFSQQITYSIHGSIDGMEKEKVYLVDVGDAYYLKDKDVAIDSCVSDSGNFKFEGKVAESGLYAIKIPSLTKQYLLFVLDSSTIEIHGNISNLYQAKVIGSRQHDLYVKYNAISNRFNSALNDLVDSIYTYKEIDSIKADQYRKQYHATREKLTTEEYIFIRNFPDAYVSLKKVNEMILRGEHRDTIQRYFGLLDGKLKSSNYGDIIRRRMRVESSDSLGVRLPEFRGADLFDASRIISNNFYTGKILIIDFWAIWCVPCIEKLPEIRNVLDRYPDEVSVLSVSLDKNAEQCMRFILDNEMPWDHLCDGLASRGAMVVDFNITAIPRVIVCDEQGLVIYDNIQTDENLPDFIDNYISTGRDLF